MFTNLEIPLANRQIPHKWDGSWEPSGRWRLLLLASCCPSMCSILHEVNSTIILKGNKVITLLLAAFESIS